MKLRSARLDPRSGFLRHLMILPFAVMTVLSFTLAATSLLAWDAAASVGYPVWAPTIAGLMFAAPILVLAPLLGFGTWKRVQEPFRLNFIPVVIWFALLCACVALTAAYLVTVNDAASYEGGFNSATQRYEPLFNLATFLQVSALLGLFVAGALLFAPARFLYWPAIQVVSVDVRGQDAIGEIMRSNDRAG